MNPDWRKDKAKRARASRHLRVANENAAARDASPEELARENAGAQVTEGGIPVLWGNSAGQRLRGPAARVQNASADDMALVQGAVKTCVGCVHFDVKHGRKAIIEQQFAEKLVLEYEWALKYVGGSVDHLALCGRSDGELCVTSMSPACDGYRPRNGRI